MEMQSCTQPVLEGYNAVEGYKRTTKGNINSMSNRHYREDVGWIAEEKLPAGRGVHVDFEGRI